MPRRRHAVVVRVRDGALRGDEHHGDGLALRSSSLSARAAPSRADGKREVGRGRADLQVGGGRGRKPGTGRRRRRAASSRANLHEPGKRLFRGGGEAGQGQIDRAGAVDGDRETARTTRPRSETATPCRRAASTRLRSRPARERDERAARGLREERPRRRERRPDVHDGADAAGRGLGERDREPAGGDVVRRRDHAVADDLDEEVHGARGPTRGRATGTGPRRGRGSSRGTRPRPSRRGSCRSARRCRPRFAKREPSAAETSSRRPTIPTVGVGRIETPSVSL